MTPGNVHINAQMSEKKINRIGNVVVLKCWCMRNYRLSNTKGMSPASVLY